MSIRPSRQALQDENIAKAPLYFEFAADFYLIAHEYIDAAAALYRDSESFQLGIAILARGTNNLQGAVVLTEVGLTSEANSLVRAALECCFALGALRSGFPLFDKLQDAHNRARRTWGRFQLDNRGVSALDKEQLDRIEKQMAETPKGERLLFEDLARRAGLTEYYETMYRPLSNFGTHLSEGSLSLLLEPSENDAEHIIMAMHGVVSTFGVFLREIDRLFPVPSLATHVESTISAFADYLCSTEATSKDSAPN